MAEGLGRRIQRMRGEERLREIRRIVSAWESSGRSKVDYCQELGVSANALTRWTRELAGSKRREAEAPALVELEPLRRPGSGTLELTLPGGARVHVSPGFDEADLARLLRVVDAAC